VQAERRRERLQLLAVDGIDGLEHLIDAGAAGVVVTGGVVFALGNLEGFDFAVIDVCGEALGALGAHLEGGTCDKR